VLTSRLGDHAWRAVPRRHDTLIRDITAAHGGTVVETQGDGSMLAFSSARRAVGLRASDPARDKRRHSPMTLRRSGSGSASTR
jgi:class 3 adenylate cyclase